MKRPGRFEWVKGTGWVWFDPEDLPELYQVWESGRTGRAYTTLLTDAERDELRARPGITVEKLKL